jgi:HlyD family secretion protein
MRDEPISKLQDLTADLDRLRLADPEEERPRVRRRRVGRWLAIASLLGIAGAYLPAHLRSDALAVSVVAVVRREVGLPPVVVSAVGYVVPERAITVAASTQGKLVDMPVTANQRVRAGDLLARLESDNERANLQLAEAERADTARELRLVRELFGLGVRTKTDLERAQSAFDRTDARVALARAALDSTVLRAPFDGTVVRKIREAGELLTLGVTSSGDPGTAVAELADLDPLYVTLEINEAEIRKVREGMVALVTPEARPDQRYLGDLVQIAARADRSKGVVAARVRIREAATELLPGMTVSVRFMSAAPRGEITARPSLPRTAITQLDGRDVVYVVRENHVEPMAVVLAETQPSTGADAAFTAVAAESGAGPEFLALLAGPEEGVYVVDSPPSTLRPGSAVRTTP